MAAPRRWSTATRAWTGRRATTPGTTEGRPMRVVFAADHAGAKFKDDIVRRLAGLTAGEHELIDLGGDGSDPEDDYPDFAEKLGQAIQDGRADRGILICGSGVRGAGAERKEARLAAGDLPRHLLGTPGRGAGRKERARAGGKSLDLGGRRII